MPSPDFGPSTQQFDPAPIRELLPPGTRLGGYQIIEVLARGNFGNVYLALDASLQRQVAIKEYLPADLATRKEGPDVVLKVSANAEAFANGLDAFLDEAKLLASFEHPSLAFVHSFWEGNGTAYMVMTYYDGQTLAHTLADLRRPPDEAWLRSWLMPLLGALNVLHSAQCYHRNISPENIFVRADGRPVLLDFAASNRVVGDKTQLLGALLNPAYAPIEQYSESATLPQGPWTDLYALAGVLHFAITGQTPAQATVRAARDTQRPLAETVRELRLRHPALQYNYSDSFLAAIDRALAVRPRDRPRDAQDFQKLLDRRPEAEPPAPAPAPPAAAAARSEPLFDIPPPREERYVAPPPARAARHRRDPSLLMIVGVCLVALVVLGAWWWKEIQPGVYLPMAEHRPPSAIEAPLPTTPAGPPPAQLGASEPALLPADPATAAAPSASAAGAMLEAMPPSASAPTPVITPVPVPVPVPVPAPALASPAPPTPAMGVTPQAAAPVSPAASAPVAAAAPAEPVPQKSAAKPATVAPPAEPNNPRAVCGSRTNFSLLYCMQAQCKRAKFAQHPQCIELRARGE